MVKDYQYTVLTDSHIEKLIDMLNSKEYEGWKIAETIQEHGFTKVILEKEINV